MLFRLYRGCCCFIAGLLALVSCNEPLGYGVFMDFFPQTCESIAVKDVPADRFSLCVMVRGKDAEHDLEIESLATDWFYQVHPGFKSTPGGSVLEALHYTVTPCTGLKILCQDNNVSGQFMIQSPGGSMCWFNKSKQIINIQESGISIKDFLDLSPLTPVSLTLFSDSLPKEEMEGRTFTIELEIDGAETLSSQWIFESYK